MLGSMETPAPQPFTLAAADGWQVSGIPAFEDNYLWLIHDQRQAWVVDPGDEDPVLDFLHAHQLALAGVLCTHHHGDHVGGVVALAQRCGAPPVYGPALERIPGRTDPVHEGQVLALACGPVTVMEVPGHTAGHVAYLWQDRIFCGDTLFALGCGRLFEGSPAQMHDSLTRLAALPGERRVHCAHEYTLSNLAFALAVDPDNPALLARAGRERATRAQGRPTVPALLSEERATNPFLRADQATLRASAERHCGGPLSDPLAVFTCLRQWKNEFRVRVDP